MGVLIIPLAMHGWLVQPPAPHTSLDAGGETELSEALMRKSIWGFPRWLGGKESA